MDISKKKLVPRVLIHRENVRTSKFWRKSKEEKQKNFRKFTKGRKGFDLGKKKSKLFHAHVPLKWRFTVCKKCKANSLDILSYKHLMIAKKY